MKSKDQVKHQFWQRHVEQYLASGLTQAQYCKQHRLREKQLSYWKIKFEQQFDTTTTAAFIPVTVAPENSPPTCPQLRITLPSGIVIEGLPADPRELGQWLQQLGALTC